MGRPKGSGNKTKQVEPEIIYVLASELMMPTQYTKFLCRENSRWIVNNAYHNEFLQLFPMAKIQTY